MLRLEGGPPSRAYNPTERRTADEATTASSNGMGEALRIVGQGLAVTRRDPIGRANARQRSALVTE